MSNPLFVARRRGNAIRFWNCTYLNIEANAHCASICQKNVWRKNCPKISDGPKILTPAAQSVGASLQTPWMKRNAVGAGQDSTDTTLVRHRPFISSPGYGAKPHVIRVVGIGCKSRRTEFLVHLTILQFIKGLFWRAAALVDVSVPAPRI